MFLNTNDLTADSENSIIPLIIYLCKQGVINDFPREHFIHIRDSRVIYVT